MTPRGPRAGTVVAMTVERAGRPPGARIRPGAADVLLAALLACFCAFNPAGAPDPGGSAAVRAVFLAVTAACCTAIALRRLHPAASVGVIGAALSLHLAVMEDLSLLAIASCLVAAETTQSRMRRPWSLVLLTLVYVGVVPAAYRAGGLIDPRVAGGLVDRIVIPNVTGWALVSVAALVGAARRFDVAAKAREVRGTDRVVVRDGEAIGVLLDRMGAKEAFTTWGERRSRRESRGTANRLANFDDANLRRSARAAVASGARVERAFEILGDDVPAHLIEAGRLRIANKQASLEELGQLSDPQLTKDAVAGRIRRLLAMADKRAHDLGIPDTESVLTPDMLDL